MSHNKKYAGFFIRLLAGIIDVIVLLPPLFILSYLLIDFSSTSSLTTILKENENTLNIISVIITIPYLTYFIASNSQATIGKKALGIYVGNIDASQLSHKRSLSRSLMSAVTSMTLGIGFLSVLFTKEKISLHDFICKTRVFYKVN
ncbi:MAG: RDD family protein [Rickettsiales bacterium]|nr:RDD family protein [Rickettsiales bacterium]